MKLKHGVSLVGLHLPMRKVLIEAERIWKAHGKELVVTSGLDGQHSARSLHYYGYAVDLRTRYFDTVTTMKVANELRSALGEKYQVIVERNHIHVEYDEILEFYDNAVKQL